MLVLLRRSLRTSSCPLWRFWCSILPLFLNTMYSFLLSSLTHWCSSASAKMVCLSHPYRQFYRVARSIKHFLQSAHKRAMSWCNILGPLGWAAARWAVARWLEVNGIVLLLIFFHLGSRAQRLLGRAADHVIVLLYTGETKLLSLKLLCEVSSVFASTECLSTSQQAGSVRIIGVVRNELLPQWVSDYYPPVLTCFCHRCMACFIMV